MILDTNVKMKKFHGNPKLFKHEHKQIDLERGGSQA